MGSCCGCGAEDARNGCNIATEVKTDLKNYGAINKPILAPLENDNGTNGPRLKKDSPNSQSSCSKASLGFDNERSTVAGETLSYQRSSVVHQESPDRAASIAYTSTPHNYLSPI